MPAAPFRHMVLAASMVASTLVYAAPPATHIVQRIDVRDPDAFDNRVITFGDLTAAGENVGATNSINGPSMLYVPDGTPNKLADYYLYFADHGGDHIRMAYGDSPTGPFTLYQPNAGVMSLSGANTIDAGGTRILPVNSNTGVGDHIASPDVRYDPQAGRFNMVYHGNRFNKQSDGTWNESIQRSFAAWSNDGLSFNTGQYGHVIGGPYIRPFEYDGKLYGMADNGVQIRPTNQASPYTGNWEAVIFNRELKDSLRAFAQLESTWTDDTQNGPKGNVNFRHHAVKIDGDTMTWWYTAKGEAPERIYEAIVQLDPDWTKWEVLALREVLRPEYDYEGADEPLVSSSGGRPKIPGTVTTAMVNELRDPAYFYDPISGREFLYYAVAGEYGIAVAEIVIPEPASAAAMVLGLGAAVSQRWPAR